MVITKASNEDGSDNSQRSSPPPRSKGPWEWLQQLVTFVRIQQPAKLALNLLLGFFLVRLLPITGRPSSEGHAVTVQVPQCDGACYCVATRQPSQVPFSEFVVRAKRNQVRAVSIDGNQLTYWLRSTNAIARELPPGADKMRLSFQTVRPLDFPTPYETLVKNNVQFTAVDKRNNRFLNIMVRDDDISTHTFLDTRSPCAVHCNTGLLLLRGPAHHRPQPPATQTAPAWCGSTAQRRQRAPASHQIRRRGWCG